MLEADSGSSRVGRPTVPHHLLSTTRRRKPTPGNSKEFSTLIAPAVSSYPSSSRDSSCAPTQSQKSRRMTTTATATIFSRAWKVTRLVVVLLLWGIQSPAGAAQRPDSLLILAITLGGRRGRRRLARTLAVFGALVVTLNGAGGQQFQERTLASSPIFDTDTSEDVGIVALAAASHALLTGDTRFVATGPEYANAMLFVVDVANGSVTTITAEELGISNLGGVTLVRVDVDDRIVAWHSESSQIITMSSTGTAVRRIPLRLPYGFMADSWELATYGSASQLPVLRQLAYGPGRGGEDGGSYRQMVTFGVMHRDGNLERIAQVEGVERVYLSIRQDSAWGNVEADVIFGETVFVAPLGDDKLIVADTDADSIRVLDARGSYEPLMPTPLRSVVVTEEDIGIERSRRKRRSAMDAEMEGLIDMVSGRHREQLIASDRARRVAVDFAPASRTPSAIAGLMVDGQSRLWLKRFVPPTDSITYWDVWNTTRAFIEFSVRVPREWDVLDARGDRVLLRGSKANGRRSRDLGRLMLLDMRQTVVQGR